MDRARDEFLAGAGFAPHEHRRHAARDFRDALLHQAHRCGLAHQPLQRALRGTGAFARRRAAARTRPLRGRRGLGDRGGHHRAELLEVHRLREVVERAGLERLDRVLGRAVGRHDDAAFAALFGGHAPQQLDALAVGQPHVGDHRLELLRRELRDGLGERADGVHAIALAQEREFVQRAQVRLVVDDQHLRGRGRRHQAAILSNAASPATGPGAGAKSTMNSLPSRAPPTSPAAVRS
jgi:hypothetical protein